MERTLKPWRRPALTVRSVYSSDEQLGPLDLVLHRGSITLLVGANGSGKSRILRLLAATERPGRGEIAGMRRMLYSADDLDLGRTMGATLDELLPQSRTEIELAELCASFGLSFDTLRPLGRLSSGQRQRLLLAAASLSDIPVMMFDSPTSSLDADGRIACIDLFERLAGEGRCVVAATLDPELILETACDVYRLSAGLMQPI